MKKKLILGLAILATSLSLTSAAWSTTFTFTVPGISDPWLAGLPDGSNASGDSFAPEQSPVLVTGYSPISKTVITFQATGLVNNSPTPGMYGPHGPDGGSTTLHIAGNQNGISDITAPFNSLLGVFLGLERPDFSVAPEKLYFDTPASLDYITLSPLIQQVFFIGDGFTSNGIQQKIIVPFGATRLFLGTMDSWNWRNNTGAFDVKMDPAPEPATMFLFCTGIAGLAGTRLKRKANKLKKA